MEIRVVHGTIGQPPLAAGEWIGRWRPGIGDPSVVGWLTVVAYLVAAWLCWRARKRVLAARATGVPDRSAALWTLLALGLLGLGINKQLDLQSAVTEFGRIFARIQGWDPQRRTLHLGFILAVAAASTVIWVWVACLARHQLRLLWPALVGAAGLCAFVAVRATSFHDVDQVLRFELAGIRLNWVLELGGIGLVALGALRAAGAASAARDARSANATPLPPTS